MSTKTDKKANRSKGSGRSDNHGWSDWAWDQRLDRYYRARQNSRGEYEYEHGQAANSTPRGATSSTGFATLPNNSTSNPTEYCGSQEYAYQDSSQSSSVAENLSVEFARASLDDEQVESSQLASYDHEQSRTGRVDGAPSSGFTPTQPIAIPQNASREAQNATTDPYASSSTSTIVGIQRDFNSIIPITSAYLTPNPTTYYQQTQPSYGSSYGSSYNQHGSSIVDGYKAPIPPAGYSASSRSYMEPLSGTQQTYESSAATGSGANTPKVPYMTISGTGGTEEALDPKFKLHQSKDFKPGHVFKVLWFEPEGENAAQTNVTEVTTFSWDVGDKKLGQRAYGSIRRFVIVAADYGHCQCLPILTYHRQATTKYGVKRDDHAIVYIGKEPPKEIDGEKRLRLRPIRIIPLTPRDKLEKESRINYAKIYTVEFNVKVYFIGRVASESKHVLTTDFDAVWRNKRQLNPVPSGYSESDTADSSQYGSGSYQ